MDRLLDLAVAHGFDRYLAAFCFSTVTEIFGDGLTVENCGEDFLASLAYAIQGTDGWGDMEVTKGEAHGRSNGIVINSSSDNTRVAAATNCPLFRKAVSFTSKRLKADLSTSKARKANSASESICDNFSAYDSDIVMLDETDSLRTNTVSVQRKTPSRNPELRCRSSSANSGDASILPGAGEEKLLKLTMWF